MKPPSNLINYALSQLTKSNTLPKVLIMYKFDKY